MKIINQTVDEMTLKDGNASGVIVGTLLVIMAVYIGYQSLATKNFLIPGVLIVAGFLAVFLSSSISVTINKINNQIVYRKKRLIGGSNSIFAISDVLRVETRRSWQTYSSNQMGQTGASFSTPHQRLVTQSVVMMKNGTELALDHQNGGNNFSVGGIGILPGAGKEIALATQVANFTGVPFQEIQPPGADMGINLGGTGIQL